MIEVISLVALLYEVSKDLCTFAADFQETPQVIQSVVQESQLLIKQLDGLVSEGLTSDDELENLGDELKEFVQVLKLDGKSRMRKWIHQAKHAARSESLRRQLTSLNRRYQAHVNAHLLEGQDDIQDSMASQEKSLGTIEEFVKKRIETIRIEKLAALHADVLRWLTPATNKRDKHDALVEQHHTGTGTWLYESAEFKAWELQIDTGTSADAGLPQEHIRALWIHGKPGAGKSTMIAQIVERLTKKLQEKAVILRVYCDYKATESQTRLMLLKDVLRQAVKRLLEIGDLPGYVEDAFHVYAENLGVKECKLLLCRVLGEFSECIMAIDGLDEYEHLDPYRNEGIDILNDLHQALGGAKTTCCHSKKMLIASRENCLEFYESSNSTFKGTTGLTKLEFVAPKGDVESMVRSYLLKDGFHYKQKLHGNPEVLTEVTEKVCEKSENLFLVAKIQLKGLDQARTVRDLKRTADALPTGMNDTYEAALKIIIHQHGGEVVQPHDNKVVLGLRILAIVSKTRRQLFIDELLHALAVEPQDLVFDPDALLDDHGDIIRTTGGLLHIRQGIIDVCHKTLTEYLCKPDTRERYFPDVVTLAEICLTYMSFAEFQEPCDDRAARRKQFPLLQYAVRNAGYHVSDALERKPELLDDCLAFLKGPPPLGTFQVAVAPTLQRPVAFRMQKVRDSTPLMHMAVLFGMPFLLEKITKESETGSRGYKEETALHTAARAQQVEAATRLVDAGEDVNATSYSGKTPLDVIMNRPYLGFEIHTRETFDVASILVEAAAERLELMQSEAEPGSDVGIDVEINIRMKQITAEDFQNMIRTGFHQTTKEHAKNITWLIAFNDVNLDITDEECEIVLKLLAAGADVNSESMPEATALQLASMYGRQNIIKVLLDRGANPFLKRSLGYTACDLARMREEYGKQSTCGQWKAIHEMLAEKMAEWQQTELDEPDEEKKLLTPGPKQAEQLEQKASDSYVPRMERMFAETLENPGAAIEAQMETTFRFRLELTPDKKPREGTDDTTTDDAQKSPPFLRLEISPTHRQRGESIFGANTPLPATSASRERSQERNHLLMDAAAADAPNADELQVRLGALNTD